MEPQVSKKRTRHCEDALSDCGAEESIGFNEPCKKKRVPAATSTDPVPATAEPGYIVIHRVQCDASTRYHQGHEAIADYFDVPRMRAGANKTTSLQGRQQLVDLDDYLDDHEDVSFAVCMTYDCGNHHESNKDAFQRLPMPAMDHRVASGARPYFYVLQDDCIPATADLERLILSDGMTEALDNMVFDEPGLNWSWNTPSSLVYPYLHLYHYKNDLIGSLKSTSNLSHRRHLSTLLDYLDEYVQPEYAEADTLLEQGLVSKKHWAKLFHPGEVVVTIRAGHPMAYILARCPQPSTENVLTLQCWAWAFDGEFFKKDFVFSFDWPSDREITAVTNLEIYPLKYDTGDLEGKLRHRGEVFWACRIRKYVSYNVPLRGLEIQKANLRYMVDMAFYKLMHKEDAPTGSRYELPDADMYGEDVPAEPFALLLPATLRGFGLHNKKWNRLQVKHIQDIQWNKGIFDLQLVLHEDKKELIRALISVHLGKNDTVRTDFMEGKGEGLIILLHGSPGTGKTLTAESVAEFAERPLYRVTCGDIGTNPESVEKYLESVLYIGSTWGCVVLLDEADVFLEERTKMDMQRNALVSVFLRVLEYYDGILILTSNRIGTFDEAFKSRVQLALHYPALDEEGRLEVWRNFMDSLSEGGGEANFEEIKRKLPTLARHTLNGRQIRNTINTARQLARYKRETLRYVHIDQALRVVNEFEKYVTDVHGHGDEEYARDVGHR